MENIINRIFSFSRNTEWVNPWRNWNFMRDDCADQPLGFRFVHCPNSCLVGCDFVGFLFTLKSL